MSIKFFQIKKKEILDMQRWLLKGGLAILDQGLFSGSNFLLNLFLARWLSPASYGSFSIVFAIFLFFSGFQNALLLEPLSVFGPSKYFENLRKYIFNQFVVHFVFSTLLGFSVALTGLLLPRFDLIIIFPYEGIVGMGLSLPFMLLAWLSRRACYLAGKPIWALVISVVYSIILFSGALIVRYNNWDAGISIWFAVIGVAGFGSSILMIKPVFFGSQVKSQDSMPWQLQIRENWLFGKWILLATILYFLGSQIQVFFIAAILNLESAGVLRALQNLILPMQQTLVAITTLVFPSIVFEFGHENYLSVRQKSLRVGLVMMFVAGLYGAILFIGGRQINIVLYGNRYSEYIWLAPLIGLIPILNSFVNPFSLILRSLQKPLYYLYDKLVVALVGIVSSYFLISWLGIAGAVLSWALVEIASLLVHQLLYRRWFLILINRHYR